MDNVDTLESMIKVTFAPSFSDTRNDSVDLLGFPLEYQLLAKTAHSSQDVHACPVIQNHICFTYSRTWGATIEILRLVNWVGRIIVKIYTYASPSQAAALFLGRNSSSPS